MAHTIVTVMNDDDKTKQQLIGELAELRARISVLEASEDQHWQTDKMLAETQRSLSTLLSNLPGMVYRCCNNRNWTMEFVSAGAYDLTGYEASDLIGDSRISYAAIIHPDDREAIWNEVQAGLDRKKPFQFTYRIITADDKVKWVWEQGRGIYSPDGELVALEGFITDITEQKRVEEKLKQSEEKFRSLFEGSKDGVLLIEGETLIDCNPALVEMMQCTGKEQLIGLRPYDFSPERQPDGSLSSEKAKELFAEAFEKGSIRFRWVHRRLNGEEFPVEVLLTSISVGGKRIFYASWRDIGEIVLAEEALRASEEQYRTLVDSSSDAIFMVDSERRIVSVNKGFTDLFGYDKKDVIGRSIRLIHPSDESYYGLQEKAFPILENLGPLTTEWKAMKKSGAVFPIEGTYSAIMNPDGSVRGYVAILRDITERKKAEEELKNHREHLEEIVRDRTRDLELAHKALVQKEKLKTLGDISAEVAHEIRNPLVSIGGFARRLQKKIPDLPEVEIILNESHRLETILNRIKNYLKPTDMRPQECHINTVVTDCLNLLSPELVRERIGWEIDLDPHLAPAYVDPGILTQVFISMVRSAAIRVKAGEVLTVRTRQTDHNIYLELTLPEPDARIRGSDIFRELMEGSQILGAPLCLRLLKEMGGLLTFAQDDGRLVSTVSLLKALQPGSNMVA